MRTSGPRWTVGVYVLLYAAAQVAFAIRTNFHLAVNDFLGILLMADNVDWGQPATLHNGFFPFALPAILHALPSGSALAVAGLLSAAFGVVVLLATFDIAARLAGAWWAVAAVVLLSLDPDFLAYFASPGPDIIASGIAIVAIAIYVREADRPPDDARIGIVLASGVLFGLAGLFRYHAALLGLGLLTWAALRSRRRLPLMSVALGGIVVGFLPQVIINLLGGFGPLESDSAFTVYQSVVSIDWHATSAIDPAAYASVPGIVAARPLEFASSYLGSFAMYVTPIVALALATLVQRPRAGRTVAFSLLVAAVGFAAVASTGNSPRGLLPLLPLAAIAIAVIAGRAFDVTAGTVPGWQRATAIIVILAALVGLTSLAEDAAVVAGRRNVEATRVSVEDAIVSSGLVDAAGQILTNDFDLYTTQIPGTNPDKIGGWPNISLNGDEPHTDVDLGSVTGFYCDARQRGIRMVLWAPGSVPGLDPDLEAVFNGAWRTPLLRSGGTIGPYNVTLLQPDALPCPSP